MTRIYDDNSLSIGHTPLIRLNRVTNGAGATVLAWTSRDIHSTFPLMLVLGFAIGQQLEATAGTKLKAAFLLHMLTSSGQRAW